MELSGHWKNCYAIVSKKTGRLALIQAEVPIYWSRKSAKVRASSFKGVSIKKIKLDKLHILINKRP